MITVRVRQMRKNKSNEQVFFFCTREEATAFVAGLRVVDSWQKGAYLLDATIEPTDK